MGLLIKGVWQPNATPLNTEYEQDIFSGFITADGSSGFKAEANRYHLYISLACPWACRTLMMRKLKKLESLISLSIVDPFMGENGWMFSNGPDCIPDTVNHCQYLHQIYTLAKPDYTGRVTVPVLWDKQTHTIVNNESAEIIRMFNSEFKDLAEPTLDYYPEALRAEIDEINERVFTAVNRGVYKCGLFATSQKDYDTAFDELFAELDQLEKHLSKHRYLVGTQVTEADIRLFSTLIRFDVVYYVHFKCNWRLILNYPTLQNYLRDIYHYQDLSETVNFNHIKTHYYTSHKHINPSGIVPKGPELKLGEAHHREKLI